MNIHHLPSPDILTLLASAEAGDESARTQIQKTWNQHEVDLYQLTLLATLVSGAAPSALDDTERLVTLTYRLAGTTAGAATPQLAPYPATDDAPASAGLTLSAGDSLSLNIPFISLTCSYLPNTQTVDTDPTAQFVHNGLAYHPFPELFTAFQSVLPTLTTHSTRLIDQPQTFSVTGECYVEITITTTKTALANL